MTTLSKEITVTGKSLMSGKDSCVKLFPSQAKGIRFFFNGNYVEASPFNVAAVSNFVVLANQNVQIGLVEHFMASLAFCGIDSLDVCIEGNEMPILDGSALDWVNTFQQEGLVNSEISTTEFNEIISYVENDTVITLLPSDKFKVTYMINFEHPELSNRWVTFEVGKNNNEIIEARTFGYLKDLERFQQAGLALGASIDNTVGLTEDSYTVELRSNLEPIKHKILDIIGDLYLTGLNPLGFKAHVIAKQAGHKSHVEFAKLILKEKNND